MSSKSKDVRIEQRRVLEKKLDLRLEQLAQKGIDKEKALNDPLVKNLKAKIRETNVRIKTADKLAKLSQDLAEAKVQKLAKAANKDEAAGLEAAPSDKKQKKQAAEAAKETKAKKKTASAAGADAKKQTPKKK